MKAAARIVLLLLAAPFASAQVPYERLLGAPSEPAHWLTYSGGYPGHRHSSLAQIDRSNVKDLKPVWVYQSPEKRLQASPIVLDGILYITEAPHVVTALDGRTGRPLWSYRRPAAVGVPGCCGPVNRGLAVLDDALFFNTYDSHLVALDLRTGRPRWDIPIADGKAGYSMTGAPLAIKDKIIIGVAGGEYGIRGFLDAYDPKTGARLWRFYTVPGPGEPGHETWKGDSWKTGGGATWVTGTYDPALNLLYWGTGNPGPDYNGDQRTGDNLYTDSLLAIDADTGQRRWHFQFTPHDLHDWDSNQVPVLFDATIDGRPRKLVAQANRNAFYYVLDRETGEFLRGAPFAQQTWASGLDARGRPILLPGKEPSAEGTLVYPGLGGGTNWMSPSYDASTGLFYVHAREQYGQVFFKHEPEYTPGLSFYGGNPHDVDGAEPYGVVKAIEATTAKIRWEYKLHSAPSVGILSTAGGLVFSGTREGYIFALDAATGAPLWRFQTGGNIVSNPVTFEIDDKQHVALTCGQSVFVFAR
jgi:alcohol dehydrogenase (cytochrome c)